ncbi:MAG: tRNA epoxyqueuosine(34) reductase QueG [Polyangiaceae bacterium]
MDLKARIVEHARILGFDAVGVARADVELEPEHGRYLGFLERGLHGSMGYLAESPEARRTLASEAILPGARSVICLARRYQRTPAEEASDPPVAQLVARYARGHDYHNHLRKKLRRLAVFVRGLAAGVEARPLCDEEPILERAWASRAGLGFIGKNGLLIVPGKGSFVLLGEVVTTLALPPDTPIAERCGACTRCLDACPTQAFDAPFVLDPRRCVAYLTIEAPLEPRARSMGEHLFGCDDRQTACPTTEPRSSRGRATRASRRSRSSRTSTSSASSRS